MSLRSPFIDTDDVIYVLVLCPTLPRVVHGDNDARGDVAAIRRQHSFQGDIEIILQGDLSYVRWIRQDGGGSVDGSIHDYLIGPYKVALIHCCDGNYYLYLANLQYRYCHILKLVF